MCNVLFKCDYIVHYVKKNEIDAKKYLFIVYFVIEMLVKYY